MRNHLFIGLGGQGGRTLAELRKVMVQRSADTKALAAQNVNTEFLAIDSSQDIRNDKQCWSYFGTDLSMEPNDWLMLESPGHESVAELAIRRDIAPWLGDRSFVEKFLSQGKIEGANQRRRFGRLLFAYNADRIGNAIFADKVGKLTTNAPNQCAFHIFATIGGGTGSGCLIDLVTTIREHYSGQSGIDEYPIFVYVYVTNNDTIGDVGYFFQNQYACLSDLNALMSDRLYPHLLGESATKEKYSDSEPIAQLVITTSLNSNNIQLPLKSQIQIVAESCLERIYAWASGQMSPEAQKIITGQDILSTFPGEPMPPLVERSYRFAGFGMRRWELPHDRLKELIALDLIASGLRQMLFNHWEEGKGFTKPIGSNEPSNVMKSVSALLSDFDENEPKPSVESLVDKLRTELQERAEGLKKGGADVPDDLYSIESSFKTYLDDNFMGSGFETFFQKRKADVKSAAGLAVQRLANKLTELWSNGADPLPLALMPQVLGELRKRKKIEIETATKNNEEIKKLKLRIEARRLEWPKLTILSGKLLGKKRRLIDAHAKDCILIQVMSMRDSLAKINAAFVQGILNELPSLQNRFDSAIDAIVGILEKTEHERAIIIKDLDDLQNPGSANKYEFKQEELQSFLEWMRNHREHQHNTASLLRRAVLDYCGHRQPLSALSTAVKKEEISLEEKLRHLALEQAEHIHQNYEITDEGTPILGGVLLDRLKQRFQHNTAELKQEARKFLDQAAVCLHLSKDTQPVTILGTGVNVPNMPKRSLLLGLPNHAYADTVKEVFRSAQNAGARYYFDTYTHDDSTQIRLLLVDYWLAARFASVLKNLKESYQHTANNKRNSDTLYFCNIDADGEKGLRPSLFLPSAEEMLLRYEAEIWLGQQPGIDVITVDQNGVFVVYQSDDGAYTEMLGENPEDAMQNTDHRKMFMLHARIVEALDGFSRDQMTALLTSHSEELQKDHGLTSPEYKRWEKMRVLLRALVN